MRRILVVANETLEAPNLFDEVRRRVEAIGECALHLVVPASHGHGVWTEGAAKAAAQIRLDEALVAFKELSASVTGEVGDPSPVLAVSDAFIAQPHDEVLISTLHRGVSRWLKQDAVSRIERAHPGIPVTHIEAAGTD